MSLSKSTFVVKCSTTRRNSVKFPITAKVSNASIKVKEEDDHELTPEHDSGRSSS